MGLTTKKDVMTLSHRDVFFRKHCLNHCQVSFLDFIQSKESSDANSELCKEDDDEAMYKNPYEIRLCD